MRKRFFSLILALVLVSTLALSVCAHEVPDPERLGSIHLSMLYQQKPVPGGTLTLYRVADVASLDGDYFFAYTEDFAECDLPLTELASVELSEALAGIVNAKNLKGTTLNVDEKGEVQFSELEIGLYLIMQEKAASGFKKINPFLVSVPQNDDGHYIYDVDTAPKNIPGPETEPTTPTEPTEPSDPQLPQTGQTNWPVPVLAVMGMLLITAGFCMCAAGKKKHHEA